MALAESNADVSFKSRIPEQVRAVLYLPALQLMRTIGHLRRD